MRKPKPSSLLLPCLAFIIMFGALCFAHPSYAQLSVKGVPYGLKPEVKADLSTPEWVKMPIVDVQKLLVEDEKLDGLSNVPFALVKIYT
jgi:hypothetical protein